MPKPILHLIVLVGGMSLLGCRGQLAEERVLAERVPQPDILFYLIDTLRQDRLGCYGYDRPTSPNIDAFAAQATLFENAIGQSTWTKASVASMFTGMWPPEHGATGWKHALLPEAETLAESLQSSGYQTVAFVGNPQVVPHYRLDQGFDEFFRKPKRPSSEYNNMFFDWLDERSDERPFFAYIHTMDPHAPYGPPTRFREKFAPNAGDMPSWKPRWKWPLEVLPFLSDLYDGEIAFNDQSFGELLEGLQERGLFDSALIVVLSDHGEEFKEHHRWRHGANLHAETLNFPLIIKFPRQNQGLRIDAPVQHIDLMPTILDYLGLPSSDRVKGRSLASLAPEPVPVYSHLFLGGSPLYHSVVDGDWKLIRRQNRDQSISFELYDWRRDRGETVDRSAEFPDRLRRLRGLLEEKLAISEGSAVSDEVLLTEELRESLEALGYLN